MNAILSIYRIILHYLEITTSLFCSPSFGGYPPSSIPQRSHIRSFNQECAVELGILADGAGGEDVVRAGLLQCGDGSGHDGLERRQLCALHGLLLLVACGLQRGVGRGVVVGHGYDLVGSSLDSYPLLEDGECLLERVVVALDGGGVGSGLNHRSDESQARLQVAVAGDERGSLGDEGLEGGVGSLQLVGLVIESLHGIDGSEQLVDVAIGRVEGVDIAHELVVGSGGDDVLVGGDHVAEVGQRGSHVAAVLQPEVVEVNPVGRSLGGLAGGDDEVLTLVQNHAHGVVLVGRPGCGLVVEADVGTVATQVGRQLVEAGVLPGQRLAHAALRQGAAGLPLLGIEAAHLEALVVILRLEVAGRLLCPSRHVAILKAWVGEQSRHVEGAVHGGRDVVVDELEHAGDDPRLLQVEGAVEANLDGRVVGVDGEVDGVAIHLRVEGVGAFSLRVGIAAGLDAAQRLDGHLVASCLEVCQ